MQGRLSRQVEGKYFKKKKRIIPVQITSNLCEQLEINNNVNFVQIPSV